MLYCKYYGIFGHGYHTVEISYCSIPNLSEGIWSKSYTMSLSEVLKKRVY